MRTRMNQVPVFVSDAGCNVGHITDRRQSPVSPYHRPTASASAAVDSPRRFISSSTSDVQSAAVVDPRSHVICPPPPPPAQVAVPECAHSSLTRSSGGAARSADERLAAPVWTPVDSTMASSLPSIPRECAANAEPAVSTKDWLDSLHRKKNVVAAALPVSRSTDRMSYGVSLNPAGGGGLARHSAAAAVGGFSTPGRGSSLAGSNESFNTSSRQSLTSVSSHDKKPRHVRFELQPTTIQRAPAGLSC